MRLHRNTRTFWKVGLIAVGLGFAFIAMLVLVARTAGT